MKPYFDGRAPVMWIELSSDTDRITRLGIVKGDDGRPPKCIVLEVLERGHPAWTIERLLLTADEYRRLRE